MRRSRYKGRALLLRVLLPFSLAAFTGCTGMVQQELDETHAKLAALQELVRSVNQDLVSLGQVVSELDDSHTIVRESYLETEDGYELEFADGKKIVIHKGIDGQDGRVFPIGVQKDEDGLYYWTIDNPYDEVDEMVWLTDADGNKVRAGAKDGVDGIAPILKIEEGAWWISVDGGETFTKIADCADMDGCGVFSSVNADDPDKVLLVLWDGTELAVPRYVPVKLSFSGQPRDTLAIAAGELLPIAFDVVLEGTTEEPLVIASGTDGTYFSEIVMSPEPCLGVVKVQAPAVFTPGYILLSAYCAGYSAYKMISFIERVVTPADPLIPVRLGSGDVISTLSYEANFDYVAAPVDGNWLTVVPDAEAGTIAFKAEPNTGIQVRTCDVIVTPKDNPDYICTTFRVYQAPAQFTVDTSEIQATADGGDFDVWMTWNPASMENLSGVVPEEFDWITAETVTEDGFRRLKVHVAPNEGEAARSGIVLLQFGTVRVGEIKVVQQAAAPAGE